MRAGAVSQMADPGMTGGTVPADAMAESRARSVTDAHPPRVHSTSPYAVRPEPARVADGWADAVRTDAAHVSRRSVCEGTRSMTGRMTGGSVAATDGAQIMPAACSGRVTPPKGPDVPTSSGGRVTPANGADMNAACGRPVGATAGTKVACPSDGVAPGAPREPMITAP